ncbi:hypothetical protein [Haloferula sp.]|uniref:hypothetical protein n=1 Tax=Haloferula sp. TaxID=2497595 RepID=UPI00329D679F
MSFNITKILSSFSLLAICLLSSCGSSMITPLSQANPNPLVGAKQFEIKDVKYTNLMVDGKSEEAYMVGIGQESHADWAEDKKWIAQYFGDHVQSSTADEGISAKRGHSSAPFVIVPTVSMIDTGYYRIPAWNAVSRVNFRVKITDRSGKKIDEIEAVHGIPFDAIFAPSTSGRLQNVSKTLGDAVGAYIAERAQ